MSTSQELKDRFSAGKTPSTSDYGALIDSIDSGGGGSITIDSTISPTSDNALKNKTLYNELRITEEVTRTVNTVRLSNESFDREIVVLDANEFGNQSFSEAGGSSSMVTVSVLPYGLDENKAYKILNSRYVYFAAEDSGNYLLKFCGDTETEDEVAYIIYNDGYIENEYYTGNAVNYDFTEEGDWYLVNFDTYISNDSGGGACYSTSSTGETISQYGNTTEQQSTIVETVTKTVKQKISELEARIAALEN